jgi:hypothetical protein
VSDDPPDPFEDRSEDETHVAYDRATVTVHFVGLRAPVADTLR